MLAPVHRFIAAESRHAAIEMEGLRIIADKVEIISRLRRELRHGDTPLFGVWFIGLEILAAKAPSVSTGTYGNRKIKATAQRTESCSKVPYLLYQSDWLCYG